MTTVKARTRNIDGARYYHVLGQDAPSVNTLKSLMASGPLQGWLINRHIAASQANAQFADGMTEVAFRKMVRSVIGADTAAIDFGNEVHEIAEAVLLDRPMPSVSALTADEADAVEANVREFVAVHAVNAVLVEQAVVRMDGGRPIYAGTLDALVEMTVMGERGLWVLDWKSGKSGIWADAALTTGGYCHATDIIQRDGSLAPMPEVDGAVAVHMRPEQWAVHVLDVSDADEVLIALARVLEWKGRERSIVGPALKT